MVRYTKKNSYQIYRFILLLEEKKNNKTMTSFDIYEVR